MNYASTANRPNPVAAMGALGVPLGMGLLLITGLAIQDRIPIPIPNPTSIFVPTEPLDPPPPPPTPDADPVTQTTTPRSEPITLPPPPSGPITIPTGTSGPLVFDWPEVGTGAGTVPVGPTALPDPVPSFDPVAATPRGNPGEWITTSDYRSTWINRGYEGVASFALNIDERGRVTDCSITRSTGHSALDQATCRLLERRARFEPARNASGAVTAGSYSSSVNWTIPE